MALQRRYVLRELYVSETHYVDDLQTVIQVSFDYINEEAVQLITILVQDSLELPHHETSHFARSATAI